MIRTRLTLLLTLSCGSCGGDGSDAEADAGTSSANELAVAYSDPDSVCGQYDRCGVTSLTQCQASFPSERQVEGALRRLDWSAKAEERCLTAVSDLDDCVADSSCSEVTQYGNAFFSDDGWMCVRPGSGLGGQPEPVRCPSPIPCQDEAEEWSAKCSALEAMLNGP